MHRVYEVLKNRVAGASSARPGVTGVAVGEERVTGASSARPGVTVGEERVWGASSARPGVAVGEERVVRGSVVGSTGRVLHSHSLHLTHSCCVLLFSPSLRPRIASGV